MLKRSLTTQIAQSLKQFPVVAMLGARQVGKTTLARALAAKRPKAVYLDLERPSDLLKLSDPEAFLQNLEDRLVVLDEIQRKPNLFNVLRPLVDARRKPGRFLILGSASPDLLRQSSETLAGRIVYHTLSPLLCHELPKPQTQWSRLWVRGGFPGSFLAASEAKSLKWREAFLQTHLERDLPGLGVRIPAATMKRFWQMLAHLHGQVWNASLLASSLGSTQPTATHHLNILEDSFMVRQLPPYTANLGKRLIKSPKIYMRDSGLLHALLNIPDTQALQGHPQIGPSWEGWGIEQALALAPASTRASFYRTATGVEMDLVLETPKLGLLALEFKCSTAPAPNKGFWQAVTDLKPARTAIIAPVKESYPIGKNAWVVPVTQLEAFIKEPKF
jgi:predicted AAA+ superfamily ATPase